MSHSIRTRFAFTVATNLFRALCSFVTGMLLARWLGPQSYGDMAFLLGTFLGLRAILDLGTSTAFFTFLSQRPRSRGFVMGFFAWLTLQFVATMLVMGLLFPDRWIETIWHGQDRGIVLLAFAATFMQNSVWPIVQQAGESQRKTVWMQGVGLVIVCAHLVAVGLLWLFGMLGLAAIFIAIMIEYALASVVAQHRLEYAPSEEQGLVDDRHESALRMYVRYCLPLLPYALISFANAFADRWLLQTYGGSVQQAYYAVGAQFAAIGLIATTSILRIFWKEIAEAHHRKDHARAGRLYLRVSRLLFLVGAMVAGFLIPWSGELLRLILGAAYVGGATTTAIMFLYPVHQSMGQIGGTMLYATERIKLQVLSGITFMIIGMVATYLVLAPSTAIVPGLGLASAGLAVKMVVVQIAGVNVVAYIITRLWNWPFDWVYQPMSLLGCVGLGWTAHLASTTLTPQSWPIPVVIGVGGILYIVMMVAFVYTFPSLAALTRDELMLEVEKAWRLTVRICTPLLARQ